MSKLTMSLIHQIPMPLACTLDCIYLSYNDNKQKSHDLLHLQMNLMITRHCISHLSWLLQRLSRWYAALPRKMVC
jgi:hypothetical protein